LSGQNLDLDSRCRVCLNFPGVLDHQGKVREVEITEAEKNVRKDPMMRYLMDHMLVHIDIGHFGRLVFAMVAHHFLPQDLLVFYLTQEPKVSVNDAHSLIKQVSEKDYSPPSRDRILEWQKKQDFKIIPNLDDDTFGNVYKDLIFPEHVYKHISEYYSHKV